jgi:hypothetical protein
MGISFGKRKVKIKLLGQSETVTEEEKPKVPVPIYQPETVSKAKPKVNRTFKEALKEITEQCSSSFKVRAIPRYLQSLMVLCLTARRVIIQGLFLLQRIILWFVGAIISKGFFWKETDFVALQVS